MLRGKDKMREVLDKFGGGTLTDFKKMIIFISHVLRTQREVAEFLGIPYSTFRRWCKRLRIKI